MKISAQYRSLMNKICQIGSLQLHTWLVYLQETSEPNQAACSIWLKGDVFQETWEHILGTSAHATDRYLEHFMVKKVFI